MTANPPPEVEAHTPGPWFVHPFTAHVSSEVEHAAPICALCWPTPYRSDDETQANAVLIAAAPNLLEALGKVRKALDLIDPSQPLQYALAMDLMRQCADAAIALALPTQEQAS